MNRIISPETQLRYIYILKIDNRGRKSRFFGKKQILYTGQTNNLKIRINQHMNGINSRFLLKNFKNSQKRLVFVSYVHGDEYEAMGEELRIKSMTRKQKDKLISSEDNMLVSYFPFKCIILKRFGCLDEQVAIKL